MLLELIKFASLLLSILSLHAVFHVAFLEPGGSLQQQLLPSLRMLVLAASVCLGSGYVFRLWDQKVGRRTASLAASLPMLLFWWGAGLMALLFFTAWLLQRYYPVR